MPFSQKYTNGIFKAAKQSGLDAICLTEHYNGTELMQSFNYIESILERQGDCFVSKNTQDGTLGLKIFFGLEVNAEEGGHFLVIGAIDEIKSIYHHLGNYLKMNSHPPFEKLLEIVKSYSVLFGVSHPYRESSKGNEMPDLPVDLLKQLDFIDLNGKDTTFDREGTETKIKALSERLGVPYLAGSDTHQTFQFGCIYNQFENPLTTISELRAAISKGEYTIVHSESARMQVTAAAVIKRTLKTIHDLGGDFVEILFDGN